MALKLTPDVLLAAYEYLRATLPFRRWKLPHGSEVEFQIVKARKYQGQHRWMGNRHQIQMSTRYVVRTDNLIQTMAHEMVHAALAQKPGPAARHGPRFQKLADLVCRHHGFDRALF